MNIFKMLLISVTVLMFLSTLSIISNMDNLNNLDVKSVLYALFGYAALNITYYFCEHVETL